MRMIRTAAFGITLCTLAWPVASQAQDHRVNYTTYKVVHKCPATGRFLPIPTEYRTKQYCFDGKYYDSSTVPRYVVDYFAQRAAESKARMDAIEREVSSSLARSAAGSASAADAHARTLASINAARAKNGLPPVPERGFLSGAGGGAGYGAQRGVIRGGVVQASNKPESKPVPLAKLQSVAVGDTQEAVVAALSQPHSRIDGLGDGEESTLTYLTDGGAFARIQLKAGVVQAVQLPQQ